MISDASFFNAAARGSLCWQLRSGERTPLYSMKRDVPNDTLFAQCFAGNSFRGPAAFRSSNRRSHIPLASEICCFAPPRLSTMALGPEFWSVTLTPGMLVEPESIIATCAQQRPAPVSSNPRTPRNLAMSSIVAYFSPARHFARIHLRLSQHGSCASATTRSFVVLTKSDPPFTQKEFAHETSTDR